jgi:ribosomal-protein-alanine N-acetyltransferase
MDVMTKRLHIRDMQRVDLEGMVVLWADPDVRRFMGGFGPQSAEEVLPWIDECIKHNEARPRYAHNCSIVERSSGIVAGWIGFGHPSEGQAQWGERDFGYSIRPEFRGRGMGSEALTAVIEFCFDVLGISSFFGETMPDNAASAGAMRKAGMKAVGTAEDGSIIFRIERHLESQAEGSP